MRVRWLVTIFLLWAAGSRAFWASSVVDSNLGTGGIPGYGNPDVILGPVDPMTGEIAGFPGDATMFNPPFDVDEILSLGPGGHVTVRFNRPYEDQPGDDLIVYANPGFWDGDFPNGVNLDPAVIFGADGATSQVEVSLDGLTYFLVAGTIDVMFPTQPWQDTGASIPSDFQQPLDPGLTLADFNGLTFAQALALYSGSAGGSAFDIAGTGLAAFQYVRVSYPGASGDGSLEIDAFAAIPEPHAVVLVLLGAAGILLRARLRQGTPYRV